MSEDQLFKSVLDMAEAAKRRDSSHWMQLRCGTRRADDSAYLTSMLLGLLIENDAIRRGIHPTDAWRQLQQQG
ncbi:MAG: hypothetical protein WAW17_12215, partial [Rhodococcus sp. (in: high G+C Gram-positive bacteria)]|uniref:hypothetical protein n=1 Tax=Rhodococcus sp. TaxID=1831 RepID=UPI003BB051C6